jgi:hypothetical protein
VFNLQLIPKFKQINMGSTEPDTTAKPTPKVDIYDLPDQDTLLSENA